MSKTMSIFILLIVSLHFRFVFSSSDAKRLYDDLMSGYNKLVLPTPNASEPVVVKLKLRLTQLIDVNLKDQIMTTSMWVEQYWHDPKLSWNPDDYGGIRQMLVMSDYIWRPDIVLYNNAAGDFELTLTTKAIIYYSGDVEWRPPAIYKSSCEMNVEFFPFDEQNCIMKFGSWTYDGFKMDLMHKLAQNSSETPLAIDLSGFYPSVEWDLLQVPATKNVKRYLCCETPYMDITFNISMRRKTLFYTVNLIIPCMGISFLTVLVFYLPSESGEKISLSVSILVALTVFFLLLAEIIPPTSLIVPLLGKYLLFTMLLVGLSICVTVLVLNVHFRAKTAQPMSKWIRRWFLHRLPIWLCTSRPVYKLPSYFHSPAAHNITSEPGEDGPYSLFCEASDCIHRHPAVMRALYNVQFLAMHSRLAREKEMICEDWKFVAMVLDRLFLWVFLLAVLFSALYICVCAFVIK